MNLVIDEKEKVTMDVFCDTDPKEMELIESEMAGRTAVREIIIGNIEIRFFHRRT